MVMVMTSEPNTNTDLSPTIMILVNKPNAHLQERQDAARMMMRRQSRSELCTLIANSCFIDKTLYIQVPNTNTQIQ